MLQDVRMLQRIRETINRKKNPGKSQNREEGN